MSLIGEEEFLADLPLEGDPSVDDLAGEWVYNCALGYLIPSLEREVACNYSKSRLYGSK